MSNLRQLGAAAGAYGNDHEGKLPIEARDWNGADSSGNNRHTKSVSNLPAVLVRNQRSAVAGAPNAQHGPGWVDYWFYPGRVVAP